MALVFDGLPTRFEGLRESEERILTRFLRDFAPRGRVTINLKFPFPDNLLPNAVSDSERTMLKELRAKRIEAVLETDTEIWLIEVKERLVPAALGELMMYERLYKQHFPTWKPIQKVVVASEDDEILHPSFDQEGVRVFILKPL